MVKPLRLCCKLTSVQLMTAASVLCSRRVRVNSQKPASNQCVQDDLPQACHEPDEDVVHRSLRRKASLAQSRSFPHTSAVSARHSPNEGRYSCAHACPPAVCVAHLSLFRRVLVSQIIWISLSKIRKLNCLKLMTVAAPECRNASYIAARAAKAIQLGYRYRKKLMLKHWKLAVRCHRVCLGRARALHALRCFCLAGGHAEEEHEAVQASLCVQKHENSGSCVPWALGLVQEL